MDFGVKRLATRNAGLCLPHQPTILPRMNRFLCLPFGVALWIAVAGCASPLQPVRIGPDTAAYFHYRDGWLYYENRQDEERLYRIRTDGSSREKLADVAHASLLGFDGPATYFGVFHNENTPTFDWTLDELYRIPMDGAPAEKIADVSIPRTKTGFIATGTSVFFNGGDPQNPASLKLDLASGGVQSLSTMPIGKAVRGANGSVFLERDGETGGIERWDPGASTPVLVLNEPVEEFAVDGDWLYFASSRDLAANSKKQLGCLYRVPAAGGTPVRLDNQGSTSIQVAGNWIYYTQGWGPLFRTRIDGSETQLLSRAQVLRPLVAGNWIYFTSGSPLEALSSKLCRIRTDGTRSETLLKARAYFVAAGPDWACYRTEDDNQLLRISVSP